MTLSIRTRLLMVLLSLVVAAWGLVALATHLTAEREVRELLDAQLAQVAKLVMATVRHEYKESDLELFQRDLQESLRFHMYESCVAFQAWSPDDKLVVQSPGAPGDGARALPEGFTYTSVAGEKWRVLTIVEPSGYTVQVADCYGGRKDLIQSIVQRVTKPLLWSLPILLTLLWVGTGRGLAPLRRLADKVSRLDHHSLEPLPTQGVPREAMPLVNELNFLFSKLHEAFGQQRRFTSDAAHELRTPLAGIKVQAELALRSESRKQRDQSIRQALRGVNRAARLVEQLLTLARIDPDTFERSLEASDLASLARLVLSEVKPQAEAKAVNLCLQEEHGAYVLGDLGLLRLMVRNLLENAIRYSPSGAEVAVSVWTDDTHSNLRVDDQGPGIPIDERERVFDRFYRLPDSREPGSGLGLSIVRRVSQIHGAEIVLSDGPAGRGLSVTARMPRLRFGSAAPAKQQAPSTAGVIVPDCQEKIPES